MDEEPAAASNHNASAAFTSTNAASPGQERDSKATLIDVSNNATSNNHTETDQANVDSWSSILSSISTSKNDLSKTILVLGGPHSGKSTLIKHLSQDGSGGDTNTPTPQDLALGFSYIDIEDEDKEDLLARLSVYQVSSTQSSLAKLASFAINPEKSKDTVVLILLDWLKPWTFLDSLKKWICILKERSQSLGADALDKMKHNVEMHLRSLLNLDPSNTTPTPDEELTPLPEGLLTENLGLRIIVVCTKSDNINSLEKEHDFKEEQIDYVQQALRTICLRYGATLIYTSHSQPKTFSILRQQILHSLLSIPTLASLPQANVVDKDLVYTPTGWDTYGKIRILREGFDCQKFSEAWDVDVGLVEAEPNQPSAVDLYQEIILDDEIDSKHFHVEQSVTAEDDQIFLEQYYESLREANAEKPTKTATASTGDDELGPSLVGPMGAAPITHQNMGGQAAFFEDDRRGSRNTSGGKATPPISSTSNGTGAPSQNEVLANFFQSLLTKKNAQNHSPSGRTSPARQAQRTPSPSPATRKA